MKLITIMTLLFLNQLQASEILSCKLSEAGNRKNFVSSVVNFDDVDQDLKNQEVITESSGEGVNIPTSMDSETGFDNYNYSQDVYKKGDLYEIDFIFYENNSVMDEVGGFSCTYKPGEKFKCKDRHYDSEDKHIMNFKCYITKK